MVTLQDNEGSTRKSLIAGVKGVPNFATEIGDPAFRVQPAAEIGRGKGEHDQECFVFESNRHLALAASVAAGLAAPLGPTPAQAEVIEGRIPLVEPPPATTPSASPPDDKPDPIVTGSLAEPSARTIQGFAAHMSAGTIEVRDSTPTNCLPGDLKEVVASVSARFGPVSIQSTHRPAAVNRRKGGARNSLHIACRAIDFRVRAKKGGVMAFLKSRPEVGGLKVYPNGIIHIDNGERRTW